MSGRARSSSSGRAARARRGTCCAPGPPAASRRATSRSTSAATMLRGVGGGARRRVPGARRVARSRAPTSRRSRACASSRRWCCCFLGSSLGNFNRSETAAFLERVADALSPGDHLLLGLDLVKDAAHARGRLQRRRRRERRVHAQPLRAHEPRARHHARPRRDRARRLLERGAASASTSSRASRRPPMIELPELGPPLPPRRRRDGPDRGQPQVPRCPRCRPSRRATASTRSATFTDAAYAVRAPAPAPPARRRRARRVRLVASALLDRRAQPHARAGGAARRGAAHPAAQPAHEPDRLGPRAHRQLRGAVGAPRARRRAAAATTTRAGAITSTTPSRTRARTRGACRCSSARRACATSTTSGGRRSTSLARAPFPADDPLLARRLHPRDAGAARSAAQRDHPADDPADRRPASTSRRAAREPTRRAGAARRGRRGRRARPARSSWAPTTARCAYDNERPAHEVVRAALPHRRLPGHQRRSSSRFMRRRRLSPARAVDAPRAGAGCVETRRRRIRRSGGGAPTAAWCERAFGRLDAARARPAGDPRLAGTRPTRTRAGPASGCPTEAEWEKAAAWDLERGTARRYPWGDAPPTPELREPRPARVLARRGRRVPARASATSAATRCSATCGSGRRATSTPYPGFVAVPVPRVLRDPLRPGLQGAARRLVGDAAAGRPQHVPQLGPAAAPPDLRRLPLCPRRLSALRAALGALPLTHRGRRAPTSRRSPCRRIPTGRGRAPWSRLARRRRRRARRARRLDRRRRTSPAAIARCRASRAAAGGSAAWSAALGGVVPEPYDRAALEAAAIDLALRQRRHHALPRWRARRRGPCATSCRSARSHDPRGRGARAGRRRAQGRRRSRVARRHLRRARPRGPRRRRSTGRTAARAPTTSARTACCPTR